MDNWFSNRGLRVIYSASSGWVEFSRGVFQAFPYFRLIDPCDYELEHIFGAHHALAVRYSAPLDCREGKVSYHIVCDRESFPLHQLCKKARHDLTHGLEYASYTSIPLDRLAHEGWILRSDTLIRQGRVHAENREFWENLCASAEGDPAFEAWGALHEGKLVAALLACTVDNVVSILYQQSLTSHLKFGVNNALAFVYSHEVMKRVNVDKVFYGLESLDAPPSVDEFKLRMGFSAQPIRQRVVLSPALRPLCNRCSHHILKLLLGIQPGNHTLAKAEGMFRFYLQGRLAIDRQDWPTILFPNKEIINSEAASPLPS